MARTPLARRFQQLYQDFAEAEATGRTVNQVQSERRQGLVTLTATTAAGRQHYAVQDVPVAEALAVATAATGDLVRPFLLSGGD